MNDKVLPSSKLRHTLKGHYNEVSWLAWSPSGRKIASACYDGTIRLWDAEAGHLLRTLSGHANKVNSVKWSPDDRTLASWSEDGTIRIWTAETGRVLRVLENNAMAWSPDGSIIASSSWMRGIELTDSKTGKALRTFEGVINYHHTLAWSPSGKMLASLPSDRDVELWDIETGKIRHVLKKRTSSFAQMAWSLNSHLLATPSYDGSIQLWKVNEGRLLRTLKGHAGKVNSVNWFLDGQTLASGSEDKTIRLWNINTGKQISILEGHTSAIVSVSISSDSKLIISKSSDGNILFWRNDTQESVGQLKEFYSDWNLNNLFFTPQSLTIATLTEQNRAICIWDADYQLLLNSQSVIESVRYTTAKIALVGDSGVGKTGLGWRLAHGEFKEQSSTHGQQFWLIDDLSTNRVDGTECEAVLWDFAGQPDYRLIHALFLEDVNLALLLFDPTDRQDPLKGVEYWLKQLQQSREMSCCMILVSARNDRGSPTLMHQELIDFCKQNHINGGYIATSALKGEGITELVNCMKALIDWNEMTATVTTATFKPIKEYVLALKEDTGRKGVLVSPSELRERLGEINQGLEFSNDEMMTAVGHLATHGYVTILRGSSGNETILLATDLLINLASSFVLEARRNLNGLGVLEEARILQRDYNFPEIGNLERHEQQILLDATTILFLKQNICFRETLGAQTFLIFPSLINQKRPMIEDVKIVDDVSYIITGVV